MDNAFLIEVDGGYGSEGPFVVGLNSGSERVGFGASNQMAAMMGKAEYKELRLSLTAEKARFIGEALLAHAERLENRG